MIKCLTGSMLVFLITLVSCDRNRETVVAEFGKNKITLDEFRTAYLEIIKQPGTFDSRALREEFLDELIARRVLAGEARSLEMDRNESLGFKVHAYRDKCMRDEHFKKTIAPLIQITEQDIEEAYQFTHEKRRVRHLFAQTRSQADSLYRLLSEGVSFDRLAGAVFSDSILAATGGDLGWVEWSELDYELAMTAFRQPLKVFSKPVQSRYGYHILQVTDYKKNPMITRREYELHRAKAQALLELKIGDRLAGEMLEKLMDKAEIRVFPRVMKPVGEALALRLNRESSPMNAMHEMQLSDAEVTQIQTDLWDMRSEKLAEINGKGLTVGEMVGSLPFVPYDALRQSYKTALDFVFRDFVLTQEAGSMHLDRSDEVKKRTRLYEEYLLQSAYRRELIRNAAVDDSEVKAEYLENEKTRFQNMPFDSVQSYIRKELLKKKRSEAVPDHVQGLLSRTAVHQYPERIHAYYDSVYQTVPR